MGGAANTVCADWRWAQDTAARNWIESPHVDLSSPDSWLDTNICLRFLLDNTGGMDESDGYVLQYRVDGGSWVDVTTTSSYVRSFGSSNFTDGDGTSQELGSGTFDEGYWDDDGAVASYTLTSGQESENEFCFQFRSADVSGTTIEVRIAFDSGGDLDGYTYSNPSCTFTGGTFQQSHHRTRYDLDALNSEGSGWIGALDANVTVNAGVIFRIRYEIEEIISKNATKTLKFQWRKGAGSWADLTYQEFDGTETPTAVPGSHITDSALYADGAATTNLLSGSALAFVAGTGEEDNTLDPISLNNEHTEYEFAGVIHTFFDGGGQNADGDTFQFRMVESDGTLLGGSYVTPTITLSVPDGYLGGCMVETPYRTGPFGDTNGNLYTVIEDSHVDPGGSNFLMIKSEDGGKQWEEMDGSNRPTTTDLESVDVDPDGDTLHIVHQRSTDNSVFYHRFRMSDHGTDPDTWEITDQSIDAAPGGGNQAACLRKRDDDTVVAFYNGHDGTNDRIYYRIRSYPGGVWGSPNNLDATATTDFWYPNCVKGASNRIHIFYNDTTNHEIYHKSLSSGDSLGARDSVEGDPFQTGGAVGTRAMSTPIYYDSSGDEKIMVVILINTGQDIYSYVVTNDGTPESGKLINDANNVQGYAEGGMVPPVTLVVDGTTNYALFSKTNLTVQVDTAEDDGGWGTDTELESGLFDENWLVGELFTHSAGNGGDKVIGYVRDMSTGGTGFIWYKEYVLEEGGVVRTPRHPAAYFGGPTLY